jgi:hypothetical protein
MSCVNTCLNCYTLPLSFLFNWTDPTQNKTHWNKTRIKLTMILFQTTTTRVHYKHLFVFCENWPQVPIYQWDNLFQRLACSTWYATSETLPDPHQSPANKMTLCFNVLYQNVRWNIESYLNNFFKDSIILKVRSIWIVCTAPWRSHFLSLRWKIEKCSSPLLVRFLYEERAYILNIVRY